MNIAEAVATRRSIRAFQDKAVPAETLRRVLDQARMAPSGCNFQPWEATVLAGAPLKTLQERLLASQPDSPLEYDFSAPGQHEKYQSRLRSLGARMYESMGIMRDDAEQRASFAQANMVSFGAPVLLLCHFPKFMKEPQWSDVGMWLQTIMLLLREEGLDSCPQEFLSIHAKLIKVFLGVSDETHIFFCGMAIGYRNAEDPVNGFERQREPVDSNVKFLGF